MRPWISPVVGLLSAVAVSLVFAPTAGALERDPALAQSPSHYLATHADDAVYWQSLNADTIATAAGRPLLITSGYSSCYWCFRMGKDTFSDHKVAAYINQHFYPVIIDSEQMAVEDRYLQAFMQETQQFSGWPITVLLSADGFPIFGVSYIDAATLLRILEQFIAQWKKSTAALSEAARADSMARFERHQSGQALLQGAQVGDLLLALVDQVSAVADQKNGGFGAHEKYLFTPQLAALVTLSMLNPDAHITAFIRQTLDTILASAMVDRIDGGIFRYSDAPQWDAPHFEQMLFTQALMAKLLFQAEQWTPDAGYAEAAVRLMHHVDTHFRLDNNWYAASLSAVSETGQQGGYYLWQPQQLTTALGPDWGTVVGDLAPGVAGILPYSKATADDSAMHKLEQVRRTRKLVRDTTLNYGWNGLTLAALATASGFDARLQAAGSRLAERVLQLTDNDAATLVSLGEYSYMAGGLVDWWRYSGDPRFLHGAQDLLTASVTRFYDKGMWLPAQGRLPFALRPARALKDTQLPSPSAEWFRIVSGLLAEGVEMDDELVAVHQEMARHWSQSMVEEAFFHPTLIASLVYNRWHAARHPESNQ